MNLGPYRAVKSPYCTVFSEFPGFLVAWGESGPDATVGDGGSGKRLSFAGIITDGTGGDLKTALFPDHAGNSTA